MIYDFNLGKTILLSIAILFGSTSAISVINGTDTSMTLALVFGVFFFVWIFLNYDSLARLERKKK